jgi:hypothetical protein
MKWGKMKTVKKGDIGEKLIERLLQQKDLAVYRPVNDGAHVVDFYCQKKGRRVFAVEAKTYPRYYTFEATGIDLKDFEVYSDLLARQGIDTVIFWIDEFEQAIYYQRISILKGFAMKPKDGKISFPLGAMKFSCCLEPEVVKEIKNNSSTNYQLYRETKAFFIKKGCRNQAEKFTKFTPYKKGLH